MSSRSRSTSRSKPRRRLDQTEHFRFVQRASAKKYGKHTGHPFYRREGKEGGGGPVKWEDYTDYDSDTASRRPVDETEGLIPPPVSPARSPRGQSPASAGRQRKGILVKRREEAIPIEFDESFGEGVREKSRKKAEERKEQPGRSPFHVDISSIKKREPGGYNPRTSEKFLMDILETDKGQSQEPKRGRPVADDPAGSAYASDSSSETDPEPPRREKREAMTEGQRAVQRRRLLKQREQGTDSEEREEQQAEWQRQDEGKEQRRLENFRDERKKLEQEERVKTFKEKLRREAEAERKREEKRVRRQMEEEQKQRRREERKRGGEHGAGDKASSRKPKHHILPDVRSKKVKRVSFHQRSETDSEQAYEPFLPPELTGRSHSPTSARGFDARGRQDQAEVQMEVVPAHRSARIDNSQGNASEARKNSERISARRRTPPKVDETAQSPSERSKSRGKAVKNKGKKEEGLAGLMGRQQVREDGMNERSERPRRHRNKPVCYWHNEKVLYSQEGEAIGVAKVGAQVILEAMGFSGTADLSPDSPNVSSTRIKVRIRLDRGKEARSSGVSKAALGRHIQNPGEFSLLEIAFDGREGAEEVEVHVSGRLRGTLAEPFYLEDNSSFLIRNGLRRLVSLHLTLYHQSRRPV